jgi:hypothetical protein
VDFSLPPDLIYQRVAAWRVIESKVALPQLASQIVLIGAGEYSDPSGMVDDSPLDIYPVPAAVNYWRYRLPRDNAAALFPSQAGQNQPAYLPVLTGVEVHAYGIHHLLTQRLVMPIPDLWLVGLAALLGKGVAVYGQRQQQSANWNLRRRNRFGWGLVLGTATYGLVGLQLYISGAVLLPWLLPSAVVWSYALPILRKKANG